MKDLNYWVQYLLDQGTENKEELLAFQKYWNGIIENCKVTFPEAMPELQLTCIRTIAKNDLANQKRICLDSVNATLQLMQVANLEVALWVAIVQFKWICEWYDKESKSHNIISS